MLIVIDVAGLTPALLGQNTPNLTALAGRGAMVPMTPVLPAVTCPAQATMLTGLWPREHGIVANGWYFRDLAQVWFWRQSNRLIQGHKIYEASPSGSRPAKVAKLFWWYNMYAPVEFAVTPRPAYPADGRKLPDIYTEPAGLRETLTRELGPFPLFRFWGPGADITSTRWIVDAALHLLVREHPDLTLVYLPHLDYDLQRFGPDDDRVRLACRAVDREVGRLLEEAHRQQATVVVLSEYGIELVDRAVEINRELRAAGWLRVHRQIDGEHLDAGASRAFAVVDHQVAHVYVRDAGDRTAVRRLLEQVDGIERVLWGASLEQAGLDHPRSGELVAVAEPGTWFAYPYWLEDAAAPDYARTVDIHKKPGYDPLELFIDPTLRWPRLQIAAKLARKKLGLRGLMDVIPLDTGLVRGSHGRLPASPEQGPLLISSRPELVPQSLHMTEVKALLLAHMAVAAD